MILCSWDSYWSLVEVVQRMEWPLTRKEQTTLVQSITPQEWLSLLTKADMGLLLDVDDWPLAPIADLDLETRYGTRRFHVWKPPGSDAILIAKRRSHQHLVVTCTLAVVDAKIEASFYLLSGTCLGQSAFAVNAKEPELYVSNLKAAAATLALQQNIMESAHQHLQLVLGSSGLLLPEDALVYGGFAVTQDTLEAQLHLLTQIPK